MTMADNQKESNALMTKMMQGMMEYIKENKSKN